MKQIIITLSDSERLQLENWASGSTGEERLSLRARVILSLARGHSVEQCGVSEGTTPVTVRKWRRRFVEHGLAGLRDAPRPGKPRFYGTEVEARILAKLNEPPPAGFVKWNGSLLARVLGDVTDDHVRRVLHKHGITLDRRQSP